MSTNVGQRDATTQYVLTAGSGAQGTSGGVVTTFHDEDHARRAFVSQRLRILSPDAWGRLAAVQASGRTDVLCWFGPTAPAQEGHSVAPVAPAEPAGATRYRRASAAVLATIRGGRRR